MLAFRTARLIGLFAVAMLAIFATGAANAQFDTGTISGSITDPSGAVVPRAAVTITNIGTANRQTVETDGNGAFVASALPYGKYVVEVSASGFGKTKSEVITLNVGATVNVNLRLSIAAGAESVVITGTVTTVDTSSATTGTTLDANQIENLPINGRDVSSFLEIAPGSINSTGFFQGSVNGLENIFTGLNIKLDGQNASRGDINGFLDTEGGEQARVTRASLDSIQEIQFANNGYSSENGFSLGPQMNIITKSGTNNFHGSVFEFFRNDALDAKDFFQAPGLPTSPLRLNQFGANLSGPIYRNKLFFFVNYEGVRQKITSINALSETLSAFARSQIVPSVEPILSQRRARFQARIRGTPRRKVRILFSLQRYCPPACARTRVRYESITPSATKIDFRSATTSMTRSPSRRMGQTQDRLRHKRCEPSSRNWTRRTLSVRVSLTNSVW